MFILSIQFSTLSKGSVMEKAQEPVAEAMGAAHETLMKDLRKLEEAASPSLTKAVAELNARLASTFAHVTEHFRFEEQNGYMDAVRKREPRLERIVEQLAEEHHQLAQSLNALVTQSKSSLSADDGFRAKVRAWIDQIRHHEARENQLVQEAFNLDLAAED